jgi:uncharacterized protein (DUF697 family)
MDVCDCDCSCNCVLAGCGTHGVVWGIEATACVGFMWQRVLERMSRWVGQVVGGVIRSVIGFSRICGA